MKFHQTKRKPHYKNQRFNKKKNSDHIHPGDLIFLKAGGYAFPADDNWNFNPSITRMFDPTEPFHYVKRSRQGRGGKWIHCVESCGLKYVFMGSIKSFTKEQPKVNHGHQPTI